MEFVHGNYVIQVHNELGRGGFGVVLRVELFNTLGNKCGDYAIKRLRFTSIPEISRRFEREVKYQASCFSEHVAPVYLHDLRCPEPWFIMDLAESDLACDLSDKNFTDEQKMLAFSHVLLGVKSIHDKNLLHRDIKPKNILKFKKHGGDLVYKVSDFGLVKNVNGDGLNSTVITEIGAGGMGTDKYMAREARLGEYSVQSDIFALGVLLDELNLGDDFDHIVSRCNHIRAEKRYDSVDKIISDFNRARGVI